MLKMVQSLFTPKVNPVGIDFGAETLRMAQVQIVDGDYRLIAAASTPIPLGARKDVSARQQFLADACRNTFAKGKFQGRQVVIGMPAWQMHVQHLRLPVMDAESIRKALPWEARGKIPIEPANTLLRHVVAGEVFQEQETKLEVIVMAAQRDKVNQFIKLAESVKLDVVGLTPEPKAMIACFHALYRRKDDPTTLYVDIGFCGTRVIVAAGEHMLFARFIPIGGDQFNYAASIALKVPVHEARARRIQLSESQDTDPKSGSAIDPISDPITAKRLAERGVIEEACRDPLERLITELELCRRYHEATFPNRPIDRVVFVGGEAMQRSLCQQIAKRLGIAAQVGDPMVRLARTSKVSPESGLDVKTPQPGWAIAVGLTIGQPAL